MSMVADRYVPDEQTPDSGLVPVTVTRLPSLTVEVYRCPVTQNLMVNGLDGLVELSPADEAALLTLLMFDE